MKPMKGQMAILTKHCLMTERSEIIFEGGSDNGITFNGSFIAQNKGSKKRYRFDDGILTKTF